MICPFTVITLKNAPKSLRGDLTKWMQEIATGVYVGNFNTKVREKLWDRVVESVDGGEATISFSYRNEIGYNFSTINADREVVDFDGIPLILFPKKIDNNESCINIGFSRASKFRNSKKFSNTHDKSISLNPEEFLTKYIVGTIEVQENVQNDIFTLTLLKYYGNTKKFLSNKITFTGNKFKSYNLEMYEPMTGEVSIVEYINILRDFVQDMPIVMYDFNNSINSISRVFKLSGYDLSNNKIYDLMKFIKKENKFFESYRLENVLYEYNVDISKPINTKSLLEGLYVLSSKVNELTRILGKK